MADPVVEVAQAIREGADRGAVLRIGKVTALEDGLGSRARVDVIGDAWLQVDLDSGASVGDRVVVLLQDGTGVVLGRLSGTREPVVPAGALVPIGAVVPYAGSSTALPEGWLLCNGAGVSRTTYANLFAIIGTTYGSPSTSTFALPDLENRVPIGATPKARGATGGTENVTLTEAQMPSHSHGSAGSHDHGLAGGHTHTVPGGAGDTTATAGGQSVATSASGTTGTAGQHEHAAAGAHTHGATGSDQPHTNMQPYLVVHYIIRAF